MNKGIKVEEIPGYNCSNCRKAFKPDKNSASVVIVETETYFCSTECLKQY